MGQIDSAVQEEMVLDELKRAFIHHFSTPIRQATPIRRGWLNYKWKITTDLGDFVLKQYNQERFKSYKPETLQLALSQQKRLSDLGFPCPTLLASNGELMLESANGEKFIVMGYCEGQRVPPGQANTEQLYELGRITGQMHLMLNDGTLYRKSSALFCPPSREERLNHWIELQERAQNSENVQADWLTQVETQRVATENLNLEGFESIESGWAHRDLWMDNLLFHKRGVAAILDFDRLNYDFPRLDVARAVMSCAFRNTLDMSLAAAFMEGYRQEQPSPAQQAPFLATSLQMLWYMESVWWIHDHMELHSLPPVRFAQEMNWLAKHINDLPAMLENL
ncbi:MULTISPECIES: phosphotransferase [Paenibacillus]|uniref:phosphotransferase n=1 Tax=Paenibacillus TaxID=44249 RepID=UPI000AA35FD6|nr:MULTISPECIES: phosphotransferase [Paenibacillus]MDU4697883.1 phosphotransferase [Paenibacillus sp.]